MNKAEIAMQLCLARINDVTYTVDMKELGKEIAELYNVIYNNLDIDEDQDQ